MNVEKLHSLLVLIKKDFDNQKIISKFSDFTWKMSQYVENASDENSASFKSALDDLNGSLELFESNHLVPTLGDMLQKINATALIGEGLRQSIENILSTNATEQAGISQQLTDLLASVNDFYERSADTIRGLRHFSIAIDQLDNDEFELGFIFPSDQFNLSLSKFKNEVIFVNKLLSDIYEITGVQPPASDIRSLSSGDVAIYLRTPIIIADKIMQLIKGIVRVYDTIGDIQKKTRELKLLEVSEHIIDLLKEEEKQRITLGLEALKINLFDRENNAVSDDGRLNELETSISIDLKQLAQKIEHGLKIEVTVPQALLEHPAEIDGIDVRQLADTGMLMMKSAFTHEPVLLFSTEKTATATRPVIDSSTSTADDTTLVTSEKKSTKKKKSTVKKKKEEEPIESIKEMDIDTNIDIDDEPEFGWIVTDD
ncbi:MAG: hypothetical protein ACC707_10190 [Thiohalomonadales bacterium]